MLKRKTVFDQQKFLTVMNEPVRGELELILERQRLAALPMTLYMCLGQNLSLNRKTEHL